MDQPAPAVLRRRPDRPAPGRPAAIGAATGAVLAVRVLSAAAGLGFGVVVARVFGASLMGVLTIGLTAALAGKLVGELGLATPMLRRVAAAADAGDWPAVTGVYRHGIRLAAGASMAVAAALVAAAPVLANRVFDAPELAGVLRILGAGVVPSVLVVIHAALLRAVHRPVAAALCQGLGPYAIATGVLLVVGDRVGIAAAAWGLVGGSTLMLAAAWLAWRRARGPLTPVAPEAGRALLAAGLPVLVVMGAHLAIEWTDAVMLGVFADPADVGVYAAASRTAAIVAFVLHATNAVTAPHYAALHARGDVASMRRLAGRSTRAMVIVALPVTAAMMLASRQVLGVFGAEFVAGGAALAILAAAQFGNVAAGSVGTVLVMTGHERRLRDLMVVAGAANVGLNALLIPFWGPQGAAVATAISLVAANVASLGLLRRRLGFTTLPAWSRTGG